MVVIGHAYGTNGADGIEVGTDVCNETLVDKRAVKFLKDAIPAQLGKPTVLDPKASLANSPHFRVLVDGRFLDFQFQGFALVYFSVVFVLMPQTSCPGRCAPSWIMDVVVIVVLDLLLNSVRGVAKRD